MIITDLVLSMIGTSTVIALGVYALRQYNKNKNPPPSIEDKIKYYEELNEVLRREQEG